MITDGRWKFTRSWEGRQSERSEAFESRKEMSLFVGRCRFVARHQIDERADTHAEEKNGRAQRFIEEKPGNQDGGESKGVGGGYL